MYKLDGTRAGLIEACVPPTTVLVLHFVDQSRQYELLSEDLFLILSDQCERKMIVLVQSKNTNFCCRIQFMCKVGAYRQWFLVKCP